MLRVLLASAFGALVGGVVSSSYLEHRVTRAEREAEDLRLGLKAVRQDADFLYGAVHRHGLSIRELQAARDTKTHATDAGRLWGEGAGAGIVVPGVIPEK